MHNDPSHVEISVNELKLLMNTLSKSVALSQKMRFAWLWLLAGLLIGVIITLLIVTLAWKKTDGTSTTSKTLLERTDVVTSDLHKIHSDIKKLTISVSALNQKTPVNPAPPLSSVLKPIESKTPQNHGHDSKYMVYLHYSDKKNKKLMENFSDFLEENGFEVSGIQRVSYQNQDIRFFNDQDKKGAQLLKKYLTGFIKPVKNINKNQIKIIDLSRKYPKAQKGLLEVWVDF
jgi:DNA replication protein DnaD